MSSPSAHARLARAHSIVIDVPAIGGDTDQLALIAPFDQVPWRLTIRAWWALTWANHYKRRGMKALQSAVGRVAVSPRAWNGEDIRRISSAIRLASMFCITQPHCLQRSAAVVRLMRRDGIPATLVIGCHPFPVRSHAWVEVDGEIVSDRAVHHQFYRVIDRWS